MTEQVTKMVIKVDLQCSRCYKKIKKVLCKIPQIRDQVFDEKQNTVTINVVCCCPEKIKQKICCKGGDIIKGIEIKVPQKPKASGSGEDKEKPKQGPVPDLPKIPVQAPESPPKTTEPEPVKVTVPVPVYPLIYPIGLGVCCRECYEGRTGGPCYHGYRGPPPTPPPPPCYEWYGNGRPVYIHDSWGCACRGKRGYYGCRCVYLCEENSSECTIM